MPHDFTTSGLLYREHILPDELLSTLQSEYKKCQSHPSKLHYNQLSGAHNPWGKAIVTIDNWALLEICESATFVDMIEDLIGPDIILWESAFFDIAALRNKGGWIRQSDYWPVKPASGIIIRIRVEQTEYGIDYIPGSHLVDNKNSDLTEKNRLSLQPSVGSIIIHDSRLTYRLNNYSNDLLSGDYFIHYMPATSSFTRDTNEPIQQLLTRQMPLINYATSPIWLVRGQDHAGNNFTTGFSPPVAQWI